MPNGSVLLTLWSSGSELQSHSTIVGLLDGAAGPAISSWACPRAMSELADSRWVLTTRTTVDPERTSAQL